MSFFDIVMASVGLWLGLFIAPFIVGLIVIGLAKLFGVD